MVKIIGIILIMTSLLALTAGTYIDMRYGTRPELTGNVVFNIVTQAPIPIVFYDYIAGAAFSYAIVSFVIGIVFLFRV